MIARLAAVAAVVLAVLASVPTVAPAAAAPSGPQLTLQGQPIAVAPDGKFAALVAIDRAPTATELVVDIYAKVAPGEIVGVEPAGGPEATFEPISLAGGAPTSRLAGFTIDLYTKGQRNPDPAWGHRIDEPGVYPVRVRLQDAEGNRLAVMMTSLVRLPADGQTVSQTQAALLVRVHRAPPASATDRAAADRADDGLIEELTPVLAALAERPDLPATFSVTPDTLARIAGDETQAAALDRLRRAVAGDARTVLDAPYVDLDPTALVRTDLADELGRQRDLGRQTLTELLEAPTSTTWQLQDHVDTAALIQLRSHGIYRTVLNGDALQGGAGTLAPVDLAAGSGTVRATTASQAFALGPDAPNDPVLAAHRLLGRLAAAGQGPTGAASTVIVSIDPAAVTPESLQVLLDALAFQTPFFAATTVDDVTEAMAVASGTTLAPADPRDTTRYATALRTSRAALNSYEAMVGGRNELVRPYEMTLAVSAARDLALVRRTRDAASVGRRLQEPFAAVSLPAKDKVTLGARDASFPLPIVSTLDYPVQVVIQLESSDRIEFPRNRIEKTLHKGRQVFNIRVKTRAPGATPVKITVRSPDDGVALAQSQYTIRSSAVSGVGIVLTLGAAGFLALWWGRHWYRNRGVPRADRKPRPPDEADAPTTAV